MNLEKQEPILYKLRQRYKRVVRYKTNTMTIYSIDDKFDISLQGNVITLYYNESRWVLYSIISAMIQIDKLVEENG